MVAFNRTREMVTIILVLTVISSVSCLTQRPTWKLFKKSYSEALKSYTLNPSTTPLSFYLLRNDEKLAYPPPKSGVKWTCVQSILFYNYSETDTRKNWLKNILRDMGQDKFMDEWAAGYAQLLDLSKYYESVTPASYCCTQKNANTTREFTPKQVETRKSCKEWILSAHYLKENEQYNFYTAFYRDATQDGSLNECVAGYSYFLSSLGSHRNSEAIRPSEYCARRLEDPSILLANWTLNEVRKPCYEWILHYGYTVDDINYNLYLAVNRDKSNDNDSSKWAVAYSIQLERNSKKNIKLYLPSPFCFTFYNKTEEDDFPFQKYRPRV